MLSTGGSVGKQKVMVTNFLVILCWKVCGFLVEAIRQYTAHLEGYNYVFLFDTSWLGRSLFLSLYKREEGNSICFKGSGGSDRAVELK